MIEAAKDADGGGALQPPNLSGGGQLNWNNIEENWLQQIATERAKEDQQMIEEFKEEEDILRSDLDNAVCEHNRLTEALLQARVLVDEKRADMDWLLEDYKKRRKIVNDQRAADDLRVRAWITRGRKLIETRQVSASDTAGTMDNLERDGMRTRGSGRRSDSFFATGDPALQTVASSADTNTEHQTRASRSQTVVNGPLTSPQEQAPHAQQAEQSGKVHQNDSGGISVVNPEGVRLGTLARITPENHWVQNLLERPLQRPVEIRLGRRLTQAQLDGIYEAHDQKKTKWLSFMIQATGSVRTRACQTCTRGQGPFSLCIMVGGQDFPRCGNCEWNKQGCHDTSNRGASRVQGQNQQGDWQSVPDTVLPVRKFTHTSRMTGEYLHAPISSRLPTTPDRVRQFSDGGLSPSVELMEITKENLVLVDDSMVFLEPEIMQGVPVRKITPEHAYWELDWKPIEATLRLRLEQWQDKLIALRAIIEGNPLATDKDRTAVFQAGRQVNRGNSTLAFLSDCEFHPYQLIAKKFITPSLIHYDTLYRMVATLEELSKFRLDVTPLQWLRHRLFEIYSENKTDFKLDRVIARLYHDPKLCHLRSKHGFGHIGRPSAARPRPANDTPGRGGNESAASAKKANTKKKKTAGVKRKMGPAHDTESSTSLSMGEEHSEPQRASKMSSRQRRQTAKAQADDSLSQDTTSTSTSNHHHTMGRRSVGKNRERRASSVAKDAAPADKEWGSVDDDLDYSGYTSTDSLTKDRVVNTDWRVHQVKTKDLTSNPGTTQYWHWVDETYAHKSSGPTGPSDFEPMFEHQVLKETEPTTGWGVFKDAINFHLRLREMEKVTYATDSKKVAIATRIPDNELEARGHVLALFKRERTKRRFLKFVQSQGIRVVQTSL